MGAHISLADLVDRAEQGDQPRPVAAGTLEWLGLAVGELPYLSSSARTVDDINWRSHAPGAVRAHLGLLGAYGGQLAASARLVHGALVAHVERFPAVGPLDSVLGDVDFLAHALIEDHPPLSRRADLLSGGYVTALAAAIQASGRLEGPRAADCAAVVADALIRGLATLLGHARLNERDREFVSARARAAVGVDTV